MQTLSSFLKGSCGSGPLGAGNSTLTHIGTVGSGCSGVPFISLTSSQSPLTSSFILLTAKARTTSCSVPMINYGGVLECRSPFAGKNIFCDLCLLELLCTTPALPWEPLAFCICVLCVFQKAVRSSRPFLKPEISIADHPSIDWTNGSSGCEALFTFVLNLLIRKIACSRIVFPASFIAPLLWLSPFAGASGVVLSP